MAGTLPPVIAVLLADTTQFMAKMGEAGVEMELISKKGGGAFQQLASVGKAALLGLGAAAIGVGVISTKMAMDFQASMERIATQAQVPQSQIAGLSDQVLTLAGKVGFSPNSLAQALYHIESTFGSTGITGAKALEMLRIGAEGAKIGGSNLTDTVEALGASLVAGIPGANDYKQVMGAINAAVGVGNLTMQDYTDSMKTGVVPVVKDFGLTLNDIGAALATFGDNNIKGADAGTKLRMAVQAMAMPIKGGKDALASMGMTLNQMAGDMAQGGLLPALEDLHRHMEAIGLTGIAMDKNGTFTSVGEKLTQIFGKRAGTGVAILYDQLARLESKFPAIAHAAGSFDEAWKQTVATGKVQWQMLISAAEALAIRIGEWLIPKLIALKDWIATVVTWLEKHRTVALMLAAAIAGPILVAIGAYIVTMIAAAAATVAATWEVLAIIAAVAALAAGVVYAYTHWGWFRDTVQEIWHWMVTVLWPGLQNFASFIGTVFTDPLQAVSDAFSGIKDAWSGITSLFGGSTHSTHTVTVTGAQMVDQIGRAAAHGYGTSAATVAQLVGPPQDQSSGRAAAHGEAPSPPPNQQLGRAAAHGFAPAPDPSNVAKAWHAVYSAMAPIVSDIGDFVSKKADDIAKWWNQHFSEIKTVAVTVWNGVLEDTKLALALLRGAIEPVLAFFSGSWKKTWEGLKNIAEGTWQEIQGIVSLALDTLMGTIGVILDLITGHWSKAWHELTKMLDNIGKDMLQILEGAKKQFVDAGIHLVEGIIEGIGSMAGKAGDEITKLAGKILDGIKHFFGISSPSTVMASQVGGPIIDGIISGAKSMVGSLVNWFMGLPGMIIGALGNIGGAFVGIGAQIVNGLISGISSGTGLVGAAVQRLVGGAGQVAQGSAPWQPPAPSLYRPTAHAAGGLASGWSWVGEKGPELAFFGQAAQIVPNHQIHPLTAGGGSGTTINNYYVTVPVQGSVVSEGDLLRNIHAGLLRMKRGTVTLGLA